MCESTLQLLDEHLAHQIRNTRSPEHLRMFASACGQYALRVLGFEHPTLSAAVEAGKELAKGKITIENVAQLRSEVSQLVDDLDQTYFELWESLEAGKVSKDERPEAFSRARAAASVGAVLEESERAAAAEAAYEAMHATEQEEEIARLGNEILDGK